MGDISSIFYIYTALGGSKWKDFETAYFYLTLMIGQEDNPLIG